MILGTTYTACQTFNRNVTFYWLCLKQWFSCPLWNKRCTIMGYRVFYLCGLCYVSLRKVIQKRSLEGGKICWNCFEGMVLKLQRAANRGIPAGKIQLFQRQKKVRSKKKPPTDWKHCFETQNAWQFGKSCVNKKQGSTLANTWRVGEPLKYIYMHCINLFCLNQYF